MTDWRHRAACRDEDPELFFPVGAAGPVPQRDIDRARAVCARCPVREQCLQWATDSGEDFGVWGGHSDSERRKLKETGQVTTNRVVRVGHVDDEIRVAALMRGVRMPSSRAEKKEAARRLLASGENKTIVVQRLRISWRTLADLLGPDGSDVRRVG